MNELPETEKSGAMDDQLKQMFDYTKFHIGMYTTLIAAIIGVFSNEVLEKNYSEMMPYVKVSIVCFCIAGMAGGLIASSIPFYRRFDDFKCARLGPWSIKVVPAIACTHIEHTAFWAGCLAAVFGLFAALK